ncbi:hypothetical protein NKJ06_11280 [Mesorhizobium sp. M0293]|uniref:hypothetical protein n=1 Tax=unclassified Mesorhizobium TaxID=325217 RepID=UPI00333CDF2C
MEKQGFIRLREMNFSLSRFWDFLHSRLFTNAATAWMRISMIIAFSFLLATGPNFQVYLVALVNSDSAAIYESAYQTDLITFPSLSDWLGGVLYWPFICAAVAIVAFSFRNYSFKKTVDSIAIFSFAILTVIDVITDLILGQFSIGRFFQNVVANLLGGVALGFTAALILVICEYIAKIFSGRAANVASGAAAIGLGVLLSTAAYYILDFFYRPLPVRIVMVLSHPAHGALITDATDRNPTEESDGTTASVPRFSFVPAISTNGFANWRKGDGPMTVRWGALGTPAKFDAEITLFGGCTDRSDLPKTTYEKNAYELPNVRSLDFWVESGLWDLNVFGTQDSSSGTFNFSPQKYAFFSTNKVDQNKTIEMEQFIDEKSTLAYKSSGEISYYALVVPFVVENDSIVSRSTILHLKVDGDETILNLTTDKPDKNWEKLLKCKQLSASSIFSRGSFDMSSMSLLGILVKIKPHAGESYVNPTHTIKVDGENGWVTIKGLKSDELNQAPSGRAEGVLVGGGVASIEVNGEVESTTSTDNIDAIGDFKGSYDTSGQIRFAGIAKLLWKNQVRANPTKWETLEGEHRAYLIALSVAVLSFASGLVVMRLRKQDDLDI